MMEYPPTSVEILQQIKEFAVFHQTFSYSGDILRLADGLMQQYQARTRLDNAVSPANLTRPEGLYSTIDGVPLSMPQFAATGVFHPPPAPPDAVASRRVIQVLPVNGKECATVAAEKNRGTRSQRPLPYSVARCKDYVDQTPLIVPKTTVEQQLCVIGAYCDGYATSLDVGGASAVLLKLYCDAYVKKCALRAQYRFLREVSVAFLTQLFTWLDSEYLCVKKQALDMVLNLSIHMQLLDTMEVDGLTAALQEELVWLATCLLQRMFLHATEDDDPRLWTSALKLFLTVVPPQHHHRVDVRVLRKFMTMEPVPQCYPRVFDILCAALCKCLLCSDNDAYPNTAINTEAVALVGGINGLLSLYRHAATTDSRTCLFSVLFVAIATSPPTQRQS